MAAKRGGKATVDLVMGLVVLDLRLMSFGFNGFGFGVGGGVGCWSPLPLPLCGGRSALGIRMVV